jgi:serine/threonine protein kinase
MIGAVAGSLALLHRGGIIHRNLTPETIWLTDDGRALLLDLGLASIDRSRYPIHSRAPRTVPASVYSAPEVVQGRSGDARSDLYSLGAILFELVTGEWPFVGADLFTVLYSRVFGDPTPPRTLVPDLSPTLEEVILHALEGKPQDRYASADEFRQELQCLSTVGVTHRAERLRKVRPGALFRYRFRGLLLGFAVAAVILACLFTRWALLDVRR